MSGQPASKGAPTRPPTARPPRDIGELRARRQWARRRTRLARIDLGLGVAAAILVSLLSPGVAITAIIAVIVLLAVLASVLVEHRARKRREDAPGARAGSAGARAPGASVGEPEPEPVPERHTHSSLR